MRYVILILSLMLAACAVSPSTSEVESNLCSIEQQLLDPGDPNYCTGPFSLMPGYTRDYAVANIAGVDYQNVGNSIGCSVDNHNTVSCVLNLDIIGMTLVCTKEGNDEPKCTQLKYLAPTGGKGTNFCTVQDQIDGRCDGPFSLLASYTRDYAADAGYSNVPESSLTCSVTGPGFTECKLVLDVPGYKIVITCEDQPDGWTNCTQHME